MRGTAPTSEVAYEVICPVCGCGDLTPCVMRSGKTCREVDAGEVVVEGQCARCSILAEFRHDVELRRMRRAA